jgi:outer membrane receptor protein involved in Fe transport
MNKKLLVLILVLFVGPLMAQQAIVRGKITDAETGEELIGATVMIVGTTQGAAADLDGSFSLANIEPGIYTLKCQYISYEAQIIETVEFTNDEIKLIDFQLQSVGVGLQEFVVKAKAIRKTDAALLAVQKKASQVVDGISSQMIRRSGDQTAAAAIKRVTGITVKDGKYVYVRGLGDRYTTTTLNGAVIPGLDPNKNSVQMDLFPSNLLDNMLIYKTFSADLPGNFSGGYINIETKEFPESYTLSFGVSLGMNTQSSFNSNFLTYPSGKLDFLGFDDGSRSLPEIAQGDLRRLNKQQLTDATMSLNKVMGPEQGQSFMNQRYSFSVGNQIDIFDKPFGFIAGFSYSNNYNFYDSGEKGLYKLLGSNEELLNQEQNYRDTKGSREVLWGALLNSSYKFSNNHKLSLNLMHNQNGVSSARYLIGEKLSDEIGMFVETRTLQYLQRSLSSAQLKGEHYLPALFKSKINWFLSGTKSSQDEPDMRFFTNSYYPALEGSAYAYAIEPSKYKLPARYFRNLQELNFDFSTDIKIPFKINNNASELKLGARAIYKYRQFRENRLDYGFNFSGSVYNNDIEAYFADENIGLNYQNAASGNPLGLYLQNSIKTNNINSYNGEQLVYAAYSSTKLNFGKIDLIVGLRFEYTGIKTVSLDADQAHGFISEYDFLPAISSNWHLSEKTNLRLSYGRTLARPTFRELAPYASQNFQGGETYVGNPLLERSLIDNLDVRAEYFMNPGEVISISGFYKRFENPIEMVDNPIAVNPEISWQNIDKAELVGIELDARKKLSFINALRNLSLGTNFSYVYSYVFIDEAELELIRASDPTHPDTRIMYGQSPYIVNAYLIYQSEENGWNANLSYNISGARLDLVVKGGTPDVFEQPRALLNLKVGKSINDNWSFSFSASNLLNTAYNKTYSYKGEDYLYSSYNTGNTFSVSLNYLIK